MDETRALPPVPVLVMVARYACPFCGRRRAAKKSTAGHISRCWLNPAVRACKTCAHFTQVDGEEHERGRPCACGQGYEQCEAGISLGGTLRAGCPLWQPKTTEEAASA